MISLRQHCNGIGLIMRLIPQQNRGGGRFLPRLGYVVWAGPESLEQAR